MDPDVALQRALRLAEEIDQYSPVAGNIPPDRAYHELEAMAEQLAALVQGLDEWIRKGGFLPGPWRHDAADEEG